MGLNLFNSELYKERMKKERKKKYKTQQAFADEIGVKLETVRNWEQGRTFPEFETLVLICNLLDCDLDYLIGRIDYNTHAIQFIHEHTGLSKNAIIKLQEWHNTNDRRELWSNYISNIISNEQFTKMMNEISDYMGFRKIEKKGVNTSSASELVGIIDLEMARLWHVSKLFTDIIESLEVTD